MLIYFTIFAVGLLIGLMWHDEKYYKLIQAQQERGDHWFNKYQAVIRHGVYYPEDYDFFNNDDAV